MPKTLLPETTSDSPKPASSAGSQSHVSRTEPDSADPGQPFGQQDSDRRFLLVSGAIFLVILTGQYLWMVTDQPDPLPWQRSPDFHLFRVDVNKSGWIEWTQLEGIGPALAHRIVADRELNGPFRGIEDLRRVEGIGPTTLDRIRPSLTISHDENQPRSTAESGTPEQRSAGSVRTGHRSAAIAE
ncbi:MAG: helix-hairpin-helix domain-containing protein [Fuerstiella sp.]